GKVPPRIGAAGNLDIDKAIFEAVARDQFALDFHDALQRFRQGKRYFADRALQPGQMRGVVDQSALEYGGYFVDAVSEEETAVENRDLGLVKLHNRTLAHSNRHHTP